MERRKHKRLRKRLETRFCSGGKSFVGTSSNLSEGGLFIRTNRGFVPGSVVDIELTTPLGVSFLKGIVIRTIRTPLSVKNGMGVELTEKDTTYINFLKSLQEEIFCTSNLR